ncbi:MAG: HD-GYP domain-containing protein [Thermodesulfobacteriota bacterium]
MVKEMPESLSFIPIPLETLIEESSPDFDIYLQQGGEKEGFVLYREANLFLSHDQLVRLKHNGIGTVFIRGADRGKRLHYMVGQFRQVMERQDMPASRKTGIIYGISKGVVENVMEDPRIENVEICKEVAAQHVALIISDEMAFQNFFKIMSYDYYTHTHSVNVCIFVTALIKAMGLCDEQTMKVLGMGALLHDVGKSRVNKAILNKRGRLTPEEFEEIKTHPEWGFKIVQDSSPLPDAGARIILNHHEKCDGSGYPRGLHGDEIDVYSKITCIVDIFDALTTNRCYKDALPGFSALEIMQNEMREQVNQALLKELIVLIGKVSSRS